MASSIPVDGTVRQGHPAFVNTLLRWRNPREPRPSAGLRRLSLVAAFRAFLVAAVVVSSAGALFAVWQSLATAQRLDARAMQRTGLALATSVEDALHAGKTGAALRAILSDRVVAYALVADDHGVVRFHMNPDLVGTRLPRTGPGAWSPSVRPAGRWITLGVGTPAYEYDYPVRTPEGSVQTVRIVLHGGAADLGGARRLWAVVGGVLGLLTVAGLAVDRMLSRMLVLREEAERRERLSLVGQMTATLAHEIRNALWGVKGYAQWLDEKVPQHSPYRADVASILQGTARIEALVEDLLLYAREETYRLEPVRLGPLIAEACSVAASGWQGAVEVDADPTLSVCADRHKLFRAVVNGVRNAVEAMGADGSLTITAGTAGEKIWMRLEDTGGGITPEGLRRVFTPFYTTKTDGTGLGLAYSRKVVEGMKGAIGLENGARGAVLTLRLPKAKEA